MTAVIVKEMRETETGLHVLPSFFITAAL